MPLKILLYFNKVVSNHVNSDHVPSFSCLDVWTNRKATSGDYAQKSLTRLTHSFARFCIFFFYLTELILVLNIAEILLAIINPSFNQIVDEYHQWFTRTRCVDGWLLIIVVSLTKTLNGDIRCSQEQFEDTKGIIRSHKSRKNRQYNGPKKKANDDLQPKHRKPQIRQPKPC